jgi:hypothetical protein
VTLADCPDCPRCGQAGTTTALADTTAVEEFVCWACDHVFTLTPDGSTLVTTDTNTDIPGPTSTDTPKPKLSPAAEHAELLLSLAREQALAPIVEQDAAGASARALTAIGYAILDAATQVDDRLAVHFAAQTQACNALTQALTALVATGTASASAHGRSANALERIAREMSELVDRPDVGQAVQDLGDEIGDLSNALGCDFADLIAAYTRRRWLRRWCGRLRRSRRPE